MNYKAYFKKELKELAGRELTLKDGVSAGVIEAAEKKLKIKFPQALRVYYSIAGRLAINKEHNRFYHLSKVFFIDDFLVFMEENQNVVFWGIKRKDLHLEDPKVYQGANIEPIKWYSEKMTFSKFIIKMFRWQRGYDTGMIKTCLSETSRTPQ